MMNDRKCDPGAQHCASLNPRGENVAVLVQGWYSSTAKIIGMQSTLFNTPIIGGGPTSDELSDKSRYPQFSRVIAPDKYQGPYFAKAVATMGWNNVGVVWGAEPYGQGLALAFVAACELLKITVIRGGHFPSGVRYNATDGPSITAGHNTIEQLKVSGVRVILLAAAGAAGIHFLRAARDAGITGAGYTWLAPDGWSGPDSFTNGTTDNSDIAAITAGGVAMFPFFDDVRRAV